MIATNFPDGFTIYTASGYWSSGVEEYSEPSRMLMVVTLEGEKTEEKMNTIAQAYSTRFNQAAVLEIRSAVTINFHTQSSPPETEINPK